MATFDDILEKAKEVTDYAGKKGSELIEVSKLKLSISQLNTDIRHLYEKLGSAVYIMRKGDFENPELMSSLADELDELIAKKEALEKKLAETRKKVHCPACGNDSPEGAVYCSKCGNKL